MIDCIDAYLRAYFYMIPNDNLSDIGNNTIVIYKYMISYIDISSVITLKYRFYIDIFSHMSQQLF